MSTTTIRMPLFARAALTGIFFVATSLSGCSNSDESGSPSDPSNNDPASAETLYKGFKKFDGNENKPGVMEDEYVSGKILSTCKVGGKYDTYFGYFVRRTTFFNGAPANRQEDRLYMWYEDTGNGAGRGAWRGREDVHDLFDDLKQLGCSVPSSLD